MGAPAPRAGAPSRRRPAPFGRWPPPKKKVYNGKWYYSICKQEPSEWRETLKRRPALRAGHRSKRKFIMGNGIIVFAGEGYEDRALFGPARGTSLGGGWAAHIRRSELPKYEGPSRISRVG